ncbi:hypothetical protein PQO03_11685 [Lentisphaera profundi]|uniref:Uncharacterized protein n=1 Tax=Lentisphaera profundi TaxID=1658616 RepID=A0ABY7W2J0_9BACT|nr:hypothetical protein [Lentisphaera profundi]WDE98503.1 hypothetical protein PQO03_11685 [Lentisphaera profundi]
MDSYKNLYRMLGVIVACIVTIFIVKSALNTAEFSESSLLKYKYKLTSNPYSGDPKVFELIFDDNQKVHTKNKHLNDKIWKVINDKHIQIGDCHFRGGEFPHMLHGDMFIEVSNDEEEYSDTIKFKIEYNGVKDAS